MSDVFTLDVLHWTNGHVYTGPDLRILLMLAEYRNRDTGLCCPAVPTLADLCAITPANVRRALRRLEERTTGVGLRIVRSPGRHRTNRYTFVFHTAEISTSDAEPAVETRAETRVNPRESARKPARKRATNPLDNPWYNPAAPGAESVHPAIVAERARAAEPPDPIPPDTGRLRHWRDYLEVDDVDDDRRRPGFVAAFAAAGADDDVMPSPFAITRT